MTITGACLFGIQRMSLCRFDRFWIVPFDVPGHRRGRGNPELADEAHGTHFYFGADMPIPALYGEDSVAEGFEILRA